MNGIFKYKGKELNNKHVIVPNIPGAIRAEKTKEY